MRFSAKTKYRQGSAHVSRSIMGITTGRKLLTPTISLLTVVVLLLVLPCAAPRPVPEMDSIDGCQSLHLQLLHSQESVTLIYANLLHPTAFA